MKKPTIYFDTNIISVLHFDGVEIDALTRRMATREWWDSERRFFEVFTSVVTEQELAEGVYSGQERSLRFVRRLKYVPIVAEARRLAITLLDSQVIPPNKPADAAQLALAVVHEMDYLLTWNYAHLANPVTQARGEKIMTKLGRRMPWIVSPDTIPRVHLSQDIRRPAP